MQKGYPISVLHLITSLDVGGAEMMLFKLLSRMNKDKFTNSVVSLLPPGPVGRKIQKLGIRVSGLSMNRGVASPLAIYRLAELISTWKPDIIQTWLYHADLLGAIASKITRQKRLIWNVRTTNLDLKQYRRLTAWTIKSCAKLSNWPIAIVTNSHAGKKFHTGLGYRNKHFEVIPNGFDLDEFKPDTSKRFKLRQLLGISDKTNCVGLVARFDPMKDHRTFFEAANIVQMQNKETHFVLCGQDVDGDNQKITQWLKEFGLSLNTHLLGRKDNIQKIMAGLDVYVSSSKGEGFPNAVGEAMSCGVPSVVTDVGDSARIVGDTGKVVPPENPSALATAILEIIDLPDQRRRELGYQARERIGTHYSLNKIVQDYERLYLDMDSAKNSRDYGVR